MGSDILSPLFNRLAIAATQRHSVTEAQSGAHALKLLEADAPFDIVVTDYAMPGMNGFELEQRIKEKNPKLPIFLATGYAELPADRSIEFGHLSLPHTSTDLASAVERASISSRCRRRLWHTSQRHYHRQRRWIAAWRCAGTPPPGRIDFVRTTPCTVLRWTKYSVIGAMRSSHLAVLASICQSSHLAFASFGLICIADGA